MQRAKGKEGAVSSAARFWKKLKCVRNNPDSFDYAPNMNLPAKHRPFRMDPGPETKKKPPLPWKLTAEAARRKAYAPARDDMMPESSSDSRHGLAGCCTKKQYLRLQKIFRDVPDEGEFRGKQPLMSTPTVIRTEPSKPFWKKKKIVPLERQEFTETAITPDEQDERFFAYPPYRAKDLLQKY
ncbi:hypothetical protein BsWGS_17014 [Bradybaena similaris]